MLKNRGFGLFMGLLGLTLLITPLAHGEDEMIEKGKKVQIDYTLTVEGDVVDTSKGKQPLEYTHGEGMLIPGLENELVGMKPGEAKEVTVAAQDGYGEVVKDAFREVPRSQFPAEITPEEGLRLSMQSPEGQQIPVTIAEVKDDAIVLDFNHPLAGKELHFDVSVVDVD
jgi:FKBP-type peptidyl-prolyl cis-trans isomerase 2